MRECTCIGDRFFFLLCTDGDEVSYSFSNGNLAQRCCSAYTVFSKQQGIKQRILIDVLIAIRLGHPGIEIMNNLAIAQ
ncbi:MAG TPA: hypothetical protein DD633_10175 [Sphaerochaeta sp.]|nr:hypothetical protein [Sphaerochaeta sp.]